MKNLIPYMDGKFGMFGQALYRYDPSDYGIDMSMYQAGRWVDRAYIDEEDGRLTVTQDFVPLVDKKAQQGGPGITQHANESVSLEEFLSSINGLSYWDVVDQIEGRNASKTVLDSQPSGPRLRYVRNPHDGNIMDMRHVLVVGFRHGRLGGALLEVLQYFDESSRGSAMNEQDFYSNMIGSNFSDMYRYHVQEYPTKLSEYLKEFFSTPARINQDYWHNYQE